MLTAQPLTDVVISATASDLTEATAAPTPLTFTNGNWNVAQPLTDVVISVLASDTGEATASPATLTFTNANWTAPQTVTVTGVDDFVDDGDILSTVTFSVVDASSDDAFDAASDVVAGVTTTDDDTAGFSVTGGPLTVSETGTTDTFTVVLTAQPLTDVVISVLASDTGEATAAPTPLTFTNGNWNVAQTVTVTGVDDAVVDGDIASMVTLSIVDASSDNAFYSLADQTVSVTTTDDGIANNDEAVRDAFESQTYNFMVRRADLITSHEPTLHSLVNRGKGDLPTGTNGFNVAGVDGDVQGTFALDSRSVVHALAAAGDRGATISPAADVPDSSTPLNAWIEGQFAFFHDHDGESSQKGDFFVGYAGVDLRVHERVVFGVMAEIDWTEERATGSSDQVDGTGWMAGPYLSAEPLDNVFFDLRAMWGQSDNSAIQDILGSRFKGGFDTDRWLVEARLSGKYQAGNLGISPEMAVIYMEENQKDFTVSDGVATVAVNGQTVPLGRLTTGLKLCYLAHVDEMELEPFVAGRVFWDFDNPGFLNLDGTVASRDDLRGAVSAGITLRQNGSLLSASATYDGIGAGGFEAIGGKLLFSQQF